MSDNKQAQAGVAAVEFAVVVVVFLVAVFGVLELARSMYVVNTLKEATRRAAAGAANISYRDEEGLSRNRRAAIFRSDAGGLLLGNPVTDAYIRIDYLAATRVGDGVMTLTPIPLASRPTCPARNRVNCTNDPNDAACIRFVRARICDPANADTCQPATYQTLVPLIKLPLRLPTAPTIVSAESLGFVEGMLPCQ